MDRLTILGLRDYAFRFFPSDMQEKITKEMKLGKSYEQHVFAQLWEWSPYTSEYETAYNLMGYLTLHPNGRNITYEESEGISPKIRGLTWHEMAIRDKDETEEHIVRLVQDLVCITGEKLPPWIIDREPRLGEKVDGCSLEGLAALKEEVEQLRSENKQLKTNGVLNTHEDKINPRKEETLYKLIIGMAQGGYGYDPNALKSSTVADIQRDLDQLGIGLSEKAIRNHLKAAKAYLPTKPVKP